MALSPGSGPLRHTIRLERRSQAQSPSGELADTWTPFATVRASLEMLRGRDVSIGAGLTQNRVTTRFRIRYLPGVIPSMRILWDGEDGGSDRVYHIVFVDRVDGKRQWMILLAEELAGATP